MGDATTATTTNVSGKTYSSASTYTVQLTVNNGTSCSANTSQTVTVTASTSITTQPSSSSTNYCLSATAATLSVVASGTSLTYQWYSNTSNSNSGGTLISGATSSSYTPTTSSAGTTYYYCIITGGCGSITSNASGAITVFNNPSSPTISPSSVCEGNNITFTASGGSIFEFTKNGVSLGSPDTTRTKTIASVTASDVICVKAYGMEV